MLKVGARVVVSLKITQIIEDEDGIRYSVEPLTGGSYSSIKVRKEDIKLVIERIGER